MKAFDKVKRDKLFEILQSKNILNSLLKSVLEIYSGNKIKVKIHNQLSEENTINHRLRKDCPLSQIIFNIHINEITLKWNQIYITFPSSTTKINTLLFADDQIVIADSDGNLQKGVFTLQNTARDFGREISPDKSEMMAFKDKIQ